MPGDDDSVGSSDTGTTSGRRVRPSWNDLSLRIKVLAVMSLPLVALAMSAIGTLASGAHERAAQAQVNRTMTVQAQLGAVLNLATDVETGARGYAITSRDEFLSPFLEAQAKLGGSLDRLSALVRDNAEQTARIGPLREAIARRLRVSQDIRLLVASNEESRSSRLLALLEEGRTATEAVRREIAALAEVENRLLAERRARARQASVMARASAVGGLALGLVGGLAATLLFTRGVGRRVGRLADDATRLGQGQPVVARSPGRDEIGRLANGLEQASRLLGEREAALREARRFLEHLVTLGPLAVLRLDGLTGRPTYASPNVERLLGLSAEQLLLSDEWGSRIHPADVARRQAALREVLSGATEQVTELRFRHPDGEERWLSALAVAEGPSDGGSAAVLEYVLDVTERRKAEQTLRERDATLQSVIAASPDVITITGLDGRLSLINPAAQRVLGYGPEELLGGAALDLIHPEDQPAAEALLQSLFASTGDEEGILQSRVRHFSGTWVTIETRARPLSDASGQPMGIIAISRDVTERARLEQAHEDARAAAEAANRSKSEFLSRMSHELRTPLNAVLGFAQVLELDELTDDQQEAVDQILKGGRHLLELINEVLDITHIETGHLSMSPEPVLVNEILGEAIELVRPLAVRRQIQVATGKTVSCERYVLADRQRFKQVLLNLLSNAIKYNRFGGSVALFCESLGDSRLGISVADTGPGIRPEHQGLLFTPFERLDAAQGDVEGTGIGLALSLRLAEAMGGTITVTSALGQGSTFRVELPIVEGPLERHARLNGDPHVDLRPPGEHSGATVLHIEDNLANLKLVEHILSGRGVRLIAAMHGRLGIELARQHDPDVILLDLHLPDIGGDRVLLRLRDDPVTAAIPVIIVSADATPGQIKRLMAVGAAAYVTKPLDVRELLALLDGLLPHQAG